MNAVVSHPFVFQVQAAKPGRDLGRATQDLIEVLDERKVQIAYRGQGTPSFLGVVEGCSEREAGELIGDLRRLSSAHPMLRVCLGGYGQSLPPTVLEDGRFTLFGEAYRSFCNPGWRN